MNGNPPITHQNSVGHDKLRLRHRVERNAPPESNRKIPGMITQLN